MASSTLQEMLGSPPQNNNNSNKWKGEWGPAGIGYGSSEDSEQNKTKPNITLQNKTKQTEQDRADWNLGGVEIGSAKQ